MVDNNNTVVIVNDSEDSEVNINTPNTETEEETTDAIDREREAVAQAIDFLARHPVLTALWTLGLIGGAYYAPSEVVKAVEFVFVLLGVAFGVVGVRR